VKRAAVIEGLCAPGDKGLPTLIVASGPSVTGERAQETMLKHRGPVIAVKDGYKLYEYADVLMVGDHRYARRNPSFDDYRGSRIIYSDPAPLPECWASDPRVGYIPKVAGAGLSRNPKELRGTFTTTALAINYAVLAGAKVIVLLGVDNKPGPNNERHFIGGIQEDWMQRYQKQRWGYERMARHLHEFGVKVYNANPNSATRTFPQLPEGIV